MFHLVSAYGEVMSSLSRCCGMKYLDFLIADNFILGRLQGTVNLTG